MHTKIKFYLLFYLSPFIPIHRKVFLFTQIISDNYYLIHPSMAELQIVPVRLTGRKQWFDQDDAPEPKP
jgi:hypothetical protein